MRKKSIIKARIIIVLMTLLLLLAGCGGASSDNIQQKVTVGRKIVADESGNVYFGFKNLICTAKMEGTEVSGFTPGAAAHGTINALAVYGDSLYAMTGEGIFRYPLPMSEGEKGDKNPEKITSGEFVPADYFEIMDDNIFFVKDDKLCFVPAGGGTVAELYEDVYDFEATDKGIYYVQEDGDLSLISPDLTGEKEIGKLPEKTLFTIGGNELYYRNGDIIESFSVKKKKSSDTGSAKDANEKYVPWSDGNNILYLDKDFESHLITSSEETEIGKMKEYPDKPEGFVYGEYLISVSSEAEKLLVVDLGKGERKAYDLKKELSEYISNVVN